MKKIKFFSLFLGLLLSIVSCTDIEDEISSDGIFKITATSGGSNTRTSLDNNGIVRWIPSDQLGVVKSDGSTNAEFRTTAKDITDDGTKAVFTGENFASGTYRAYYPYLANAPISATNALSLTGQTQNGKNTDHIGKYDLLLSNSIDINASATMANFKFSHALTLLQLELYLTAAQAEGVKVTSITFMAHNASNVPVEIFATGVYFDPVTGNVNISGRKSSEMTLNITNAPALGTDAATPFVASTIIFNNSDTYPYLISVAVKTGTKTLMFDNIREVTSSAYEFKGGSVYSKSLAMNMSKAVDRMNVPDANFRAILKSNSGITFTNDNEIEMTVRNLNKVNTIKELNIGSSDISDLTGIEHFKALTTLDCSNSPSLVKLDLSKNTALTKLVCIKSDLTTLDLSKNMALTFLDCYDNSITTLDLSKNTELTSLFCNDNSLTSLDLSKNTKLTLLNCRFNQLTTIDLSKNTALDNISCDYNRFTTLDLSRNPELTALNCNNNSLTAINLLNNQKLTSLYCGVNSLAALDLSKNTVLSVLDCNSNSLTTLDVSTNTVLSMLDCYNNSLTTLNIKHLSKLSKSLSVGNQKTGNINLIMTSAQNRDYWTPIWSSLTDNKYVTTIIED